MLNDVLSTVELHQSLVLAVPFLVIIGFVLKKSPMIADWIIVWILLVIGAVIGVITLGYNFEGVANGVIAGGLAIATHQTYKQTKNKQG